MLFTSVEGDIVKTKNLRPDIEGGRNQVETDFSYHIILYEI